MRLRVIGFSIFVVCINMQGYAVGHAAGAAILQSKPSGTLPAFSDEQELKNWFKPFDDEKRRAEKAQRERDQRAKWEIGSKKIAPPSAALEMASSSTPLGAVAPQAPAEPSASGRVKAEQDDGANESITNTQTADVDEGGIVKVHGRHLVVLRRGRLFTLDVGRNQMKPIAAINAYGSDVSPQGAWYDEMLISGNTIVVIGYSYSRGGTEVALFNIGDDGQLSYRNTWHLKSADYYSSRNYASRLIGSKLIFYTPMPLHWGNDPLAALPAVRPWRKGAERAPFRRIAEARRIYHTNEPLDAQQGITLHTVVSCDLAKPGLDCQSTGVLAPASRVFYVSGTAVYVWASAYAKGAGAVRSSVFRLPLDGSAPSGLKAEGSPIDQFSFLESDDGHLNVLLRAQGSGDGMWRAEMPGANLALVRVPLSDFGNEQARIAGVRYRALPATQAMLSCELQNRFVGDYLLYGAGCASQNTGKNSDEAAGLQLVHYASRRLPLALHLIHGVERIEALGQDAVVAGTSGKDLVFSSISLGKTPAFAGRYIQANASQGETRSHGFFYKPDELDRGVLGLPVRSAGESRHRQLWEESAAMLYLRNDRLRLTPVGMLHARRGIGQADNCQASCTDWYGNSRPVFLRNRVFALMGYELVEGRLLTAREGERIVETRRVAFHPGSADYQP